MYSFVVPVYNVETDYLKKCLDTLELQKKHHEIIVVDDGSCEDKAVEYKRMIGNYNSARLFRTPNRGVSSARNFGMSKVSGDWVLFVDSDDWVERDLLNNIEKNISNDVDIIMFDAYVNMGGGTGC